LGASAAVVAGAVAVSFGSYRLGFNDIGLILVIQTVLVFGAAISYCGTSWPKWYEQRGVRRRILLTLLVLLATHGAIIGLTISRLRAEWGAPVWMLIGLGEIVCITVVLRAAVRDVKKPSRDSLDTL
jgi:hypothetical protein